MGRSRNLVFLVIVAFFFYSIDGIKMSFLGCCGNFSINIHIYCCKQPVQAIITIIKIVNLVVTIIKLIVLVVSLFRIVDLLLYIVNNRNKNIEFVVFFKNIPCI